MLRSDNSLVCKVIASSPDLRGGVGRPGTDCMCMHEYSSDSEESTYLVCTNILC